MHVSQLKLHQPKEKNICSTCGTYFNNNIPQVCNICADERQYVPLTGQSFASYDELKNSRSIRINQLLDNVYDLRITPAFAIGQKAHLIITEHGNILWDCLPLLNEETIEFINAKGGLKGIAISHPHYYSLMLVWAETFNCPIYLHQLDSNWVNNISDHIQFWDGEKIDLFNGMQLIQTGGHFLGSSILHAPNINTAGSLFVGDTLQISVSRQYISMMYSYPNIIPLPLKQLLQIHQIVSQLNFDSMYGAFEWQIIHTRAKELFEQSVKRYLQLTTID